MVLKHEKYEHSFAHIVGVLVLAFKTVKPIKMNQFTFSWRTTIILSGDLISLVFLRGLAFRLIVESY